MVPVWALLHFRLGVFHAPALKNNAVHADNESGSVSAMVAMYQHRPQLLLLFDQVQNFCNLLGSDIPGQQRTIQQNQIFVQQGSLVFAAAEIAQIDNAFDAKRFHGFSILCGQLFAAVELVIHTVKIGVLFDQRCPVGGLSCRSGG